MSASVINYTAEYLLEKRKVADAEADLFVASVVARLDEKARLRDYLAGLVNNQQLTDLPPEYAKEPLFASAMQLPAWANEKQMQQGAAFFARHAGLIMNMLGLLSLPYCYAAADGARVLYLSERLRNDTARRLQETGDFVWEVMAPNAFKPEGKGFASIIKVRLIHAMARYYTLQSGKWQAEWGQPVNQEDMAGTNLSFSLLVIRGLRKLEVAVSYADQQAFMHVWNVIGYLSGVEESLLPQDGKQAIALEQGISSHQFKPSEQGRALAQSLIDYFTALNLQPPFGSKETVQLMRFLLGDEVANIIGLPHGEAPRNVINLLKLSGTIQELKWMPSISKVYSEQYADFRKQQKGLVS
ncbi:oxygenase MpaB family protein [Mucilaginibacter sp. PAMB04168]|uniref:oxygenase MpaB family protein n=1 Tax=Mucilaginibacter sp. PAMB04168 TaxID=3138567 RepID=UPI0031F6CA57